MTEREFCLVSSLKGLRAARDLVAQSLIHTYTPDLRDDIDAALGAIHSAIAKLEPEIKVREVK